MTEAHDTARRVARELVAELSRADASLVNLDDFDLAPALEQQLFFALRDGRTAASGVGDRLRARLAGYARPLGAAVLGAVRRAEQPGPAPLVVLVREPTHYVVLQQIEDELRAMAGEALALVRVGRAASVAPVHAVAPRLADMVLPARAGAALAHEWRLGRLGPATRAWHETVGTDAADNLRRIARVELGRIALGVAGIASIVDRWGPAVLVAFDEKGTWARILPAVGSRMGVPTLDLPHSETSDPAAVAGLEYDRMAVYGSRATDVLREAGYAPERIVEIGAPRFDPLAGSDRAADGGPRRVVFAAQYVSGAMQPDVHAACYRAALAAATASQASELVVVPHPAEPAGTAAALVAAESPQVGPRVRVAAAGSLHAEIGSSWLLVTGWSNSVFEAAVAGIPAIAVNPGGVSPVDFAADGLALPAGDEAMAAGAAASLLDPATRAVAVTRARTAAEQRLGRLDGRASQRAARLILELAGRPSDERAA